MAVTVTLYNHTAKLFANGEVDLSALKVMLTSGYSFSAAHTAISSVTGSQVSGNGWTSGGELVGSAAVTTVTTNDAKLDGDDISKTATGGAIGPATAAVLYDATSSKPLAHIDFGATKQADDTTDFKVVWNASGILTWTYT